MDSRLMHGPRRWKPIEGVQHKYLISDFGDIYSFRHRRLIKASRAKRGGYPTVSIYYGSKRREMKIHRLVCKAFNGGCGIQCRHLDGTRDNNYYRNLAWGTQQDNTNDAIRHGTITVGEKHGLARKTDDEMHAIYHGFKQWNGSQRSYAKHVGVHEVTLSELLRGTQWKHLDRTE